MSRNLTSVVKRVAKYPRWMLGKMALVRRNSDGQIVERKMVDYHEKA